VQTNGALLDQSWLALLRELDIRFGIKSGRSRIN
jgi:sulfatase maturation enzyme AslB (radical SAM superfamily)